MYFQSASVVTRPEYGHVKRRSGANPIGPSHRLYKARHVIRTR